MKLYTFMVSTSAGRFERIGVESNGKLVDLNMACALYMLDSGDPRPYEAADFYVPTDMVRFLENGTRSKTIVEEVLAYIKDCSQPVGPGNECIIYQFDEVSLMAPVPKPNIVWDSMVFLEHFRHLFERDGGQVPEVFYKMPCYATQPGFVTAGTGDPIIMPKYTNKLDFELELGLYIRKKGINIAEDEAEDYIGGFTVYNDISARDIQDQEMQMTLGPAKGKHFEHGNIMGPCLVTPDEVDFNNLKMIVRVNGEVVATDNSRDMYHKFPAIISRISEAAWLRPGDFIASGTSPHGTTHASTLKRWLQPGDVVEMEIEGIGTIRNTVVTAK